MFYKIIAYYAVLLTVLNGNDILLGMNLAERIDPIKTPLVIATIDGTIGSIRSLSLIISADISDITFQEVSSKEISLKKMNDNHNLVIGKKIIAQVKTSMLNGFVEQIKGYYYEYDLKFEILDKAHHLHLAQTRKLQGLLDDYVEISFEIQFNDRNDLWIEDADEGTQKMLEEKNYNLLMLADQEQKRAENKDRLFKNSLYCGICLAMVLVGCWLRHIYTS